MFVLIVPFLKFWTLEKYLIQTLFNKQTEIDLLKNDRVEKDQMIFEEARQALKNR